MVILSAIPKATLRLRTKGAFEFPLLVLVPCLSILVAAGPQLALKVLLSTLRCVVS